jgi:spoIIIJ-associated protein
MVFEFEGRTEKEAIDRAAGELGLEKDDFDVEILETQKTGLFKKGFVRIRVHVGNFGSSTSGRRKPDSSHATGDNEESSQSSGQHNRSQYSGKESYIGKTVF